MNPKLIFAIRVSLALVWFYNGLWLKLIAVDPHHLDIVASVAGEAKAAHVLGTIGGCETLLAVGVLSGLFYKFVSYFQIVVILAMNVTGAATSSTIEHPFGLIISNLPTVMCALVVALNGPGAFALKSPWDSSRQEKLASGRSDWKT